MLAHGKRIQSDRLAYVDLLLLYFADGIQRELSSQVRVWKSRYVIAISTAMPTR